MRPRLVTIPLSHYCERARWALDHAEVAYDEERHLQVFHMRPVRRAGGRRTVPVLVTREGALTESRDIVRWASDRVTGAARLYPDDPTELAEVLRLESAYDAPFGVETRKLAYWWFLPQRRLLLQYNNQGAPAWERAGMGVIFPLAKKLVMKSLRIDASTVVAAEAHVWRVMDEVAERLRDGRRYLVGDRFTAADLTFAAMSAIVLFPEEYGVRAPSLSEMPDDVRAKVVALRQHPAGAFGLRLYREHRRRSAAEGCGADGPGPRAELCANDARGRVGSR